MQATDAPVLQAGAAAAPAEDLGLKVLVVEDEPKAAEYLRQGLSESGFVVEVARDGTDGLHAAANGDHDLVILDVMLPGIDGFAVLSALRTSRQVPVLVLTARDRLDDKVRGFELGADDYLVKPFQFPELLARVRALLKRNQVIPADPVVRVADLEIDPIRHRATRGGQRIDLSAKEFALLSLLAQRTGQVLSRTQIASLVWDIHFDSDTNVIEVGMACVAHSCSHADRPGGARRSHHHGRSYRSRCGAFHDVGVRDASQGRRSLKGGLSTNFDHQENDENAAVISGRELHVDASSAVQVETAFAQRLPVIRHIEPSTFPAAGLEHASELG